MKVSQGQTAFVTGGASGVGLGLASAFAARGLSIVIADIEPATLEKARARLTEAGAAVSTMTVDVSSRDAVKAAADESVKIFGGVHIVCNNAGVVVAGPATDLEARDWDWIIDVNLFGVIYGMEAFLPHFLERGHGYFVNTASVAGLLSAPQFEPYSATKHAVVGMSEGWAEQLSDRNIGVSVLCPGFVKSKIFASDRNRPERYGEGRAKPVLHAGTADMSAAIAPEVVGDRVIEAIEREDFYILPHIEYLPHFEKRLQRIMEAFDVARQSPLLAEACQQELPDVVRTQLGKPG